MIRHTLARMRRFGRSLLQVPDLHRRNEFLLNEVRNLSEQLRALQAGEDLDQQQTRASFDYQWHEMPKGSSLPTDAEFAAQAEEIVCRMAGKPRSWFDGKTVVDVGCGLGRFTLPMLQMGARVTAVDQSAWALTRTQELASKYADRLEIRQANLLDWDEVGEFDLAFSYGVVHHTGNTYLAIRNVARKVGPGGSLFLMVYGYPRQPEDFTELNTYERLRQELRNLPMEEKQRILVDRFGPDAAHGYFDAVSPRINDLLTFGEVAELLSGMGFENIRETLPSRNIHVAADKGCSQPRSARDPS